MLWYRHLQPAFLICEKRIYQFVNSCNKLQVNVPSANFRNESNQKILAIAIEARHFVANKYWDFSAFLGIKFISDEKRAN